jgi:DNA-binding transcriptional regulator YiaG
MQASPKEKTMKHQRREAEQWQQIVAGQGATGQNDAEYAQAQGVSVSSLRAWRSKLRREPEVAGSTIIELLQPVARPPLKVILPNGIRLEVTPSWPLDHLGRVVGLLRSL